jgi:hypothetical protein
MPTYSDAEMKAIMGRALQIDSGRSDRFTPEQLRTVAAELGISTQALEVAMYEADVKGVQVQAPQAAKQSHAWARGLAIAVGILAIVAAGAAIAARGGDTDEIHQTSRAVAVEYAPARAVPAQPAGPPDGRIKITTKKPAAPR